MKRITMSRKSTNTDEKLLLAGRKLLIKKGASKLSIREIAEEAKVNLGMFNYHFGSKEKFIERILGDIYDEFISNFELAKNDFTLKTLETQLLLMAMFARDNRHLILVLLSDILNDEKAVQKFARLRMKKHFIILGETLKGCQEKKLIMNAPIALLLTQIAGSIGLSGLIPEIMGQLGISKVNGTSIKKMEQHLVSDDSIKLRVHIIMKGLKRD